ncbi:MAG: LemA family protein [Bacteroidetes bacterium]|nr:MAG: LemA family protein [Bacteroidota bacterium]
MGKTAWIIIVVLIVAAIMSISKYNTMVGMEESVSEQWANVETQYQRRADLIPNLVSTVKGYAAHEKDVFESVTKARASATSIKIDASNLTAENIKKFQAAQGSLNSSLGRLLAVAERYPDLKANQNFLELQAQLEGTENRIAVERRRFNEQVKFYNTYIRKFPSNLVASMFGFEKQVTFDADEGAEKAPDVQF